MVYREPVDECIDYIVNLLEEAAPDLPTTPPNPIQDDGRITQSIALGIRAKALVLAASPLFNGNSDYANWTDNRGKHLVSPTFSRGKSGNGCGCVERSDRHVPFCRTRAL